MSDAGWTALTALGVSGITALAAVAREWIRARYGVDVLRSGNGDVSPGHTGRGAKDGGQAQADPPPATSRRV